GRQLHQPYGAELDVDVHDSAVDDERPGDVRVALPTGVEDGGLAVPEGALCLDRAARQRLDEGDPESLADDCAVAPQAPGRGQPDRGRGTLDQLMGDRRAGQLDGA